VATFPPSKESSIPRRGVCFVLSAPSGAGKSTIANALRAAEPKVRHSVSVTTRQPRPGEHEGVHYYFRSLEQFESMAANGELLEWARVFGRGYGTPCAPVEAALAAGLDMIFDIDWQGHRQMRQALPNDVVSLFILPPSLQELERRLHSRASDDNAEIAHRMAAARDEIAHWQEFDHVIINDDLDHAIASARSVLTAARLTTRRRVGLENFVSSFAP